MLLTLLDRRPFQSRTSIGSVGSHHRRQRRRSTRSPTDSRRRLCSFLSDDDNRIKKVHKIHGRRRDAQSERGRYGQYSTIRLLRFFVLKTRDFFRVFNGQSDNYSLK